MYKVKLVMGLREKGKKKEGKLLSPVVGAIVILEILDKDTTDLLGADNVAKEVNSKQLNARVLGDHTKYLTNGISIPRAFEELRKSFMESPVNTDADVLVSIGTMEHTLIEDFIPREDYRRTKDEQIVRMYMDKINNNPVLRQIMRS